MRMRTKQRLRRATETVRLQTLTRDACWTAASTRAPTEPTADDLPQDASLSPDAVRQVFSLDRCHTCDFIARFCRTSARLYRARRSFADAATVELHTATLSRKQTRRLLHQFSRFTILLHIHSSKMAKLFYIQSFLNSSIDRTLSLCKTAY